MGDAASPAPNGRMAVPSPVLPVRILTHNVRFATDTPDETEKLWPDRFPHLSSHFKYHTRPYFAPQTTLVCMQEVLHEQLLDLHSQTFNTGTNDADDNDWTYVGVGRNDGAQKGEYSPIFFRKSAWRCIHFETVWLNETREVGKKGWDADSIRILTCAVLESVLPATTATASISGLASGSEQQQEQESKKILAMNTHLDNDGAISRLESAKLIIQVARDLQARYAPAFTFLSGDLNSHPEDDAYKTLNAEGSGFIDTRRLLPSDKQHPNEDGKIYAFGNELTFTGFPADPAAKARERIDFIHLGVDGELAAEESLDKLRDAVQGYAVLPNRFDDRVWLSDHRGVVVDLLVPW
jgi:hypothetical protein